MSKKPSDGNVLFNTEVDPEAELDEMQRYVNELQENVQLKVLQETAAQDEGQRKSTVAAPTKNPSIFIGGMDPRTTEGDLRVFFASCGTIKRLTMLRDKFTGQQKGIAYIEFENAENASAAILKDGQSLHGKPLNIAMKRDNIPSFQRGRGGGFPHGGMPFRGRGAAQMAMAATMMATMMGGGMGFTPFGGAPRGRGRGRGGPY